MIPGISGDLLSTSFLDTVATADAEGAPAHNWMRAVLRWWRRAEETIGPATPSRTLLDVGARPLLELLDLRLLHVERHPWGHAGIVAHGDEPVASLASVLWGTAPRAAWRLAHRAGLGPDLSWTLLFTGRQLAVADAARPWSCRFVVFDFAGVCRHPGALKLLRSLAGGAALRGGAHSRLALAAAACEADGRVVCAALGRGVLEALRALVGELGSHATRGRTVSLPADRLVLEQSLTIVYRLLFLLFAEARDLVPIRHRVYRDAYSMQALCDRVIDDPGARGVWSAMQAMSRLAHAGCVVDDLRVTAFNGRLFAPRRTPLAESGHVSDTAAAGAVLSLGTTATRRGRQRIAFHDLGVEQLGAVYEQVLDYEPARVAGRLTLGATSVDRKTSGSFYTPRALTDFMVRRTLGPLVQGKSAEELLRLRILDPAMGSGAFLVAACRYLTERIEQASPPDDAWVAPRGSEGERAEISRLVAERCLYGIDRNPTAVQLARLSLWLTTLASDRPLTFLDHHLGAGNSLIGARLGDLAFPPDVPARRAAPGQASLFDDDARQAWGRLAVPERLRLALEPSNTAADVKAKERRFEALSRDATAARWASAADLWCGLALVGDRIPPGLYDDLQAHVLGGDTALASRSLGPLAVRAMAAARRHGALHWELLFPEVFVGPDGLPRPDAGFDAIIGNPPWEMVRADSGDDARRADDRDEAKAVMRFVRRSGHYPLHAAGHVNHYQLFVERALQALRPRGRLGLILPSGLQSDVGSAGVRRAMLDRCRIDTWMSLDNRAAIFPIHRGVRFLLVAATSGGRTEALPIVDGGSDLSALARLPDDPRTGHEAAGATVLARAFLERWDPAGCTVPLLGTPLAMTVAATALDAPALASREGWSVTFGRELNATDDRRHFIAGRRDSTRIPVLEGKHLRPFAVDAGATSTSITRSAATTLAGDRWTRPRVAYRDVASATNRLTLIAAVLPPDVVSTHTVFCAREPLDDSDAWCLMGLLNSLIANYLVRVQMGTHVTATLMARLPVPRPSPGSAAHRIIVESARLLSHLRTFEDDAAAYARLNAAAARLYGLTATQYRHVVSTFPLLSESLREQCVSAYR